MVLALSPVLNAAPVNHPPGPGPYLVRNWTTVDGVPHNTVRAILQSRDGYLWMGTANGLARFDGVRFVVFDLANTPELISDDIVKLYEDRQGNLWMRTRRGLARRHQDGFEFLSLEPGGPPARVRYFAEDATGTLWFCGLDGLARWTGNRLERVPAPGDESASSLYMCGALDGSVWLTGRHGLYRSRGGPFEFIPTSPAPAVIAAGEDGRIWGLVTENRLFVLTEDVWAPVADFGGEKVTSLYAAPDGDVWVGSDTRNRAFRVRGSDVLAITEEDGLEGNRVLCFLEDHDGNVWLGSNAGGLYRLRERRLRIYNRTDGLQGLNLSSITQLPDSTIMVNVMGSLLHRFAGQRFVGIDVEARSQVYDLPTAVIAAPAGGVWAGNFYGRLQRFEEGKEVGVVGSDGGTRSLFIDREGNLWRGTHTNGIDVLRGTNLTTYTTAEGLSFNNVYCFTQDRDGAIWAGTEQGLNRIVNGRITRFGPSEGLGHQFVSVLTVDSRGTLWAGTLGGGLSAWTGERFVTLTTREGLPHNAIEQLLEDDFGNLWIGTRVGLMRVAVRQLHEILAGRASVVNGRLLGRDDGFIRASLWTEYQPASLKARDGRLWFCTGGGVVMIDPREFAGANPPPVVHIEEMVIDGRPAVFAPASGETVTVPSGSERLEIRFTGISLTEPEQVRFRYRLADYDRDWVEAQRSRSAAYSHLPPGSYRFHVRAANTDGVWNTTGDVVQLIVRPAIWQTAAFKGGAGLLIVLALSGGYRIRIRQLERRRAAQEAFSRKLIESQEQERQRIAAELHDSLGQNLLVIKNRAALALAQRQHPDKMATQLTEVSTLASAAIREVRTIAQNLRPFQLDELGLTKSIGAMARQLGDASGVAITVDLANVDGLLPPAYEINFYRIIQECLNNIAKHSQAGAATIALRRDADLISLVVTDNGCGFPSADTRTVTQGFGLRNIAERTRTMGGRATIHSQPGNGTQIQITLPIPPRAQEPNSSG